MITHKVLDYGRISPPWDIIGPSRHLAWPVDAYRVTLPKVDNDKDGLNPFERAILKILDSGGAWDRESLRNETGMPSDLTQSILLRLQDKGFTDSRDRIISEMRDKWTIEDELPTAYSTVLIFRELAQGKILPYVHFHSGNDPLKIKEMGKAQYKKISYCREFLGLPPTPHDVIKALRSMKVRSQGFDQQVRLPAVRHISIVQEPERYFLYCPIGIQKRDGEFRIADPFGAGFSLILEHSFNSALQSDERLSEWLMDWKEGLANPVKNENRLVHREAYETDTNIRRYPELIYNLRMRRNSKFRSLRQIYASLEWALFYSAVQRNYGFVVDRLSIIDPITHAEIVKAAAEHIGLVIPRCGFVSILAGKLDSFVSGAGADMWTVLSISLLLADEDPSHPLWRIAKDKPDLIDWILSLKSKRDYDAHGKGLVRAEGFEFPENPAMQSIVSYLLPEVRFVDSGETEDRGDFDTDLILDARISIQHEFGFELFYRLGTDLQDRLIFAERFWITCEDQDDAIDFVWDLYAALQKMFSKRLFELSPPDLADSNYAVMAETISVQIGLGKFPSSLLNVKASAVRETLLGNDQTLGSCLIAFFLMADIESLSFMGMNQPSFITDITVLMDDYRKHGNKALHLPKEDVGRLRKSIYTTIRTLLEA